MKSVDFVKTLGAAVCVTVALSAYAQDNSAQNAAPAAAAPAQAPAQSARKVDRRLGYQVRRALSRTQGLNVSNISVRARGGAVLLTGTVPNAGQIDQAGQVAKGVAGVTSVTNHLTVAQQ
ncbi:BON domain-containing protein [Paraburkholderia dinghuensis]|uniref:BON domain-containing protein n=1 Tax=Paraburkholderia dinghuensis TaxID=2305225 RepID=A0A3N6N120_9BURK|nr:BON domain-containing protein [Paraburkholderia dinghuensis]RQH04161.1 BON domain-containing protein [Paraburkholderia dinghuensis]